jgi:hypothetical protein
MRYWLARLPFTFLILGGWLAYEGYQTANGRNGPGNQLRVVGYFVGAILSIALAIMALRERHRRRGD